MITPKINHIYKSREEDNTQGSILVLCTNYRNGDHTFTGTVLIANPHYSIGHISSYWDVFYDWEDLGLIEENNNI